MLLYGSGKEKIAMEFKMARRTHSRNQPFEGVIPNLTRRYRETNSYHVRYEIEKFMSIRPCSLCGGARLKSTSLAVRVGGGAFMNSRRFPLMGHMLFLRV